MDMKLITLTIFLVTVNGGVLRDSTSKTEKFLLNQRPTKLSFKTKIVTTEKYVNYGDFDDELIKEKDSAFNEIKTSFREDGVQTNLSSRKSDTQDRLINSYRKELITFNVFDRHGENFKEKRREFAKEVIKFGVRNVDFPNEEADVASDFKKKETADLQTEKDFEDANPPKMHIRVRRPRNSISNNSDAIESDDRSTKSHYIAVQQYPNTTYFISSDNNNYSTVPSPQNDHDERQNSTSVLKVEQTLIIDKLNDSVKTDDRSDSGDSSLILKTFTERVEQNITDFPMISTTLSTTEGTNESEISTNSETKDTTTTENVMTYTITEATINIDNLEKLFSINKSTSKENGFIPGNEEGKTTENINSFDPFNDTDQQATFASVTSTTSSFIIEETILEATHTLLNEESDISIGRVTTENTTTHIDNVVISHSEENAHLDRTVLEENNSTQTNNQLVEEIVDDNFKNPHDDQFVLESYSSILSDNERPGLNVSKPEIHKVPTKPIYSGFTGEKTFTSSFLGIMTRSTYDKPYISNYSTVHLTYYIKYPSDRSSIKIPSYSPIHSTAYYPLAEEDEDEVSDEDDPLSSESNSNQVNYLATYVSKTPSAAGYPHNQQNYDDSWKYKDDNVGSDFEKVNSYRHPHNSDFGKY